MDRRTSIMTASGLTVLAGLWLIIAPFVLGFGVQQAVWDSVIIGIVAGVLAALQLFGLYRAAWIGWVNAVLGLWLIASPFILGFQLQAEYWNTVILGIIVLGLGIWSGMVSTVAVRQGETTTSAT